MRKNVSITGNTNIFDQFKKQVDDGKKTIFGQRGEGVYQDSVLEDIQAKVHERTLKLDKIIKERIANEQWVSMVLTGASICCIVGLWFKM